MRNGWFDGFAIEVASIVSPGVVGSGLVRFDELIEFLIEGFGRDNFCLFALFVMGGEV